MTEREVVKQTADVLRGIIRSIDKRLSYSLVEQTQEGRFSLRLSSHGREGIVSLLTDDLRMAGKMPSEGIWFGKKSRVRATICYLTTS